MMDPPPAINWILFLSPFFLDPSYLHCYKLDSFFSTVLFLPRSFLSPPAINWILFLSPFFQDPFFSPAVNWIIFLTPFFLDPSYLLFLTESSVSCAATCVHILSFAPCSFFFSVLTESFVSSAATWVLFLFLSCSLGSFFCSVSNWILRFLCS